MKRSVDFGQPLQDLDGEPLVHSGEAGGEGDQWTLGEAVCTALRVPIRDDKRDALEKTRDWKLALKIARMPEGESMLEVNDKQVRHIIDLVNKVFPSPEMVGQVVLLLDPDFLDEEKED